MHACMYACMDELSYSHMNLHVRWHKSRLLCPWLSPSLLSFSLSLSLSLPPSLSLYIYIYIHTYIYTHTYSFTFYTNRIGTCVYKYTNTCRHTNIRNNGWVCKTLARNNSTETAPFGKFKIPDQNTDPTSSLTLATLANNYKTTTRTSHDMNTETAGSAANTILVASQDKKTPCWQRELLIGLGLR